MYIWWQKMHIRHTWVSFIKICQIKNRVCWQITISRKLLPHGITFVIISYWFSFVNYFIHFFIHFCPFIVDKPVFYPYNDGSFTDRRRKEEVRMRTVIQRVTGRWEVHELLIPNTSWSLAPNIFYKKLVGCNGFAHVIVPEYRFFAVLIETDSVNWL